ncbi:Negative regulator of mitotic exit [Knufia peltigerae]|uniref:Negative regulator of mitotic exit n=1 Tax=Knufia peltigerae TaxID=1002370 RepID=A0AA38Y1B4_9EURO|nr:Negative regulator of mitotic exit [Knufia peltigerae]
MEYNYRQLKKSPVYSADRDKQKRSYEELSQSSQRFGKELEQLKTENSMLEKRAEEAEVVNHDSSWNRFHLSTSALWPSQALMTLNRATMRLSLERPFASQIPGKPH